MQGILAISSSIGDAERDLLREFRPSGLGGVEVRGDLILEREGRSREELADWIRQLTRDGHDVLATIRLPGHGGEYRGSEAERVEIYQECREAGARMVDVEWGSPALDGLADVGESLIVSQHDFEGHLDAGALRELEGQILDRCRPAAIKAVPTARTPGEALEMLRWTASADGRGGTPRRIGFSMGEAGVFSRILALAHGSLFTYAAAGKAVAPGQVPLRELLSLYRAHQLTRQTRILGVLGGSALRSFSPYLHDPSLARRKIDAVYLPFQVDRFEAMEPLWDGLPIAGLSVTIPFKEEALAHARGADARSQAAGAANTLVREAGSQGGVYRAHNTDFDGVILPVRDRLGDLKGLSVGIVGAGGAARGAARALLEAGALPHIYYRNVERGAPVAVDLGIPGDTLENIRAGVHALWINATPLGGQPGDPSPLPDSVHETRLPDGNLPVFFDMIYHPARTSMLARARDARAEVIEGSEMLVAQGTVQFELFTGQPVSLEEFAENYARGRTWREEDESAD